MWPDRRCRFCGFSTQATDGTGRRQIQIQNCIISGQMEAKLVIVSRAIDGIVIVSIVIVSIVIVSTAIVSTAIVSAVKVSTAIL